MGDDVSRALLMFSESMPLGRDGLFWLKVDIANLHGNNKISLEDRVRWVDDRKDIIAQACSLSVQAVHMCAHSCTWICRYLERLLKIP